MRKSPWLEVSLWLVGEDEKRLWTGTMCYLNRCLGVTAYMRLSHTNPHIPQSPPAWSPPTMRSHLTPTPEHVNTEWQSWQCDICSTKLSSCYTALPASGWMPFYSEKEQKQALHVAKFLYFKRIRGTEDRVWHSKFLSPHQQESWLKQMSPLTSREESTSWELCPHLCHPALTTFLLPLTLLQWRGILPSSPFSCPPPLWGACVYVCLSYTYICIYVYVCMCVEARLCICLEVDRKRILGVLPL